MEDNEVKEIARMQQLIDAYELHIKSVDILIRHCGTININYPITIRTPFDKEMNEIWRFVKSRVKEGKG